MLGSRLCWAAWTLVPVAVLAYHFGPGQLHYVHDRAAGAERNAVTAESDAVSAQEAAYAKHLVAIDARRAALLANTPEAESTAIAATKDEDAAYAVAAGAWKKAADCYGEVQTI